ncbi:MAG: S49 family peptidase [Phycisphaerales bacterium]|nr:S49 family peptidase [Phycisphaerales bacterium]
MRSFVHAAHSTLLSSVAAAGLVSFSAQAEDVSLAVIEIYGAPAEVEVGYSWLGDGSDSLLGIISTIDTLAYDKEFAGLVIRLKDSSLSATQVEEIGSAIERLREADKKVHVFAEGYGTTDLLLASYADEVLLQKGGYVSFPGLHSEEMYLADTLEWIGVEAQLVQVGDYKGANEQMTRSQPSPAWDKNIDALLDSMYANMREKLMRGRDLTETELDESMRVIWAANGEEAIDAGVIDAEIDLPLLRDYFSEQYDGEVEWVSDPYDTNGQADSFSPFSIFSGLSTPSRSSINIDHPTIAVLHVNGTIIDGDSSSGGLFGGGSSVGSRTIRNAIETILEEELIEGVVVRIDSPGGSAIASEVMWQGIERLKTEKPVWVSVGSMAASGGYYVLSAGDRVFVNPSSIVGSIGVVGGKYAMGDLYDKAKINIVERSRGPMGDLFSSASAWDSGQISLMRREMKETYNLFTSRVEAGREGIDLSKTAEGRLFVGSDAIDLDMADDLGGLDDAINTLAAEVELVDFDVVHYPQPPSFEEMLLEQFGQFLRSPRVSVDINPLESVLRTMLGEARYESVVDTLNALALLERERVLLVNPRVIHIR